MNSYLVRDVNLATGKFLEQELTKDGLNYLKRDHIQVLDIMEVKERVK
ncbi:hypothetical protein [uncultured Metabacillus sp.]|nr:hypothetical protein [uncultured Metabacillus sp.]